MNLRNSKRDTTTLSLNNWFITLFNGEKLCQT